MKYFTDFLSAVVGALVAAPVFTLWFCLLLPLALSPFGVALSTGFNRERWTQEIGGIGNFRRIVVVGVMGLGMFRMKHTTPGFCCRTLLLPVILLTSFALEALGQANVQGQWSTLPYLMPINPIHVALLHNGKILIVAGSGACGPAHSFCPSGPPYGPANGAGAAIWDPSSRGFTQLTVNWDMFCNGMVVLPDGRAFIDGGTLQYHPFKGVPNSSIFEPSSNVFTDAQNMAHGRWYPTVLTLGDGRIMAFSGLAETGLTNSSVEIYTVGLGWGQEYQAGFIPPTYPRLHLLPSGNVFYTGGMSSALLIRRPPLGH
jgi:hypothetical protein